MRVSDYSFGSVRVDGVTYDHDLPAGPDDALHYLRTYYGAEITSTAALV